MDGLRLIRLLDSDEAATVLDTADDTGTRLLYIVGARPLDRDASAAFTAWSRRLRAHPHPHLAPIVRAGFTEDDEPFLFYPAGATSLAERMVKTPPEHGTVLLTATLLAGALATLHAAGLTHGAVAPSTVLYTPGGRPVLGPAVAPFAPARARTDRYAAPEEEPGRAADVYGLAASAYAALGGRPGDEAATDPPGIPAALTGTLRMALHPDPSARPSAALLHDALAAVRLTGSARPRPVPPADAGAGVRPVDAATAAINRAATGARTRMRARAPRAPMPPGVRVLPPPRRPGRTLRRVVAVTCTALLAAGAVAWVLFLRAGFAGG